MIITMTVQGTENELPKIKKALDILGAGTLSVQTEFKGNGEAKEDIEDEAEKATGGKRVGRPVKSKAKAEEAESDEVSNDTLLGTVKKFCDKYPKLNANVTALLREFGCERVTQMPADMRAEFLSQLQSLPTLS